MGIKEIVYKCRSYRRFHQERRLDREFLLSLVDAARVTASGRNLQPLKYAIIDSADMCTRLFPSLAWAGYLKDWDGPAEGERPVAYIVMCNDTSIVETSLWDQGIAAQTIMLAAMENGVGGCIIGSMRRDEVSSLLGLADNLVPVLVLALGYPAEKVVMTTMNNNDVKYYRDAEGVHYVPKRSIDEVVIK